MGGKWSVLKENGRFLEGNNHTKKKLFGELLREVKGIRFGVRFWSHFFYVLPHGRPRTPRRCVPSMGTGSYLWRCRAMAMAGRRGGALPRDGRWRGDNRQLPTKGGGELRDCVNAGLGDLFWEPQRTQEPQKWG